MAIKISKCVWIPSIWCRKHKAEESDALPWNLYVNNAEKWDIQNSITAVIHIITGRVPFIRQWAVRWESETIKIKIPHGISGIMSIGWSERIFRG